MARFQDDDIVTLYFVVNKGTLGAGTEHREIYAWTENKELAKYFMQFHNCKNLTLKSVTDQVDRASSLIEENLHSEIIIRNITIKNPEKKHGKPKTVQIPMTQTESDFINEESSSFLATYCNYTQLNMIIPFLKKKYQYALRQILLLEVINKVIHNKPSKILENITLDELSVLYKSFPTTFG